MEKIYEFENETDTLGSLLQNEILKNEDVEFCGYIKDHPNIDIIKLKIITKKLNPDDVLKQSISNLIQYFNLLLKNC